MQLTGPRRPVTTTALPGFTSFDSKLLRTFTALLFWPGRLSREHLDGRRVRYMAPLRVFLVTSVLFYCFFERAYAAPIESLRSAYDRGVWLGNVLRYDIVGSLTAKAASTHRDADALAMQVFERAGQESKLFLGVLIPFLAAVLHLLFWRRQPRFVPHLIAAVHSFSLFLLLDLAFLFVCRLLGLNQISDWAFLPLFSIYAAHLFFGLRRIYGARVLEAAWKSLTLVASLVALIVVYRQFVTVIVAELA